MKVLEFVGQLPFAVFFIKKVEKNELLMFFRKEN